MKKQKLFQNCTVIKTRWVSHHTWNIVTGEKKLIKEGYETGPCGVPLFGKDEKETGICSACKREQAEKEQVSK